MLLLFYVFLYVVGRFSTGRSYTSNFIVAEHSVKINVYSSIRELYFVAILTTNCKKKKSFSLHWVSFIICFPVYLFVQFLEVIWLLCSFLFYMSVSWLLFLCQFRYLSVCVNFIFMFIKDSCVDLVFVSRSSMFHWPSVCTLSCVHLFPLLSLFSLCFIIILQGLSLFPPPPTHTHTVIVSCLLPHQSFVLLK